MISTFTNDRNLRNHLICILLEIFPEQQEQLKPLLLPENMYKDIILDDVTFEYNTHFGTPKPQITEIVLRKKKLDGKMEHIKVSCANNTVYEEAVRDIFELLKNL